MYKFVVVSGLAIAILSSCDEATANLTTIEMTGTNASQSAKSFSSMSRAVSSEPRSLIDSSIPVTNQEGNSDGSIELSEAWVNVIDISLEHSNGNTYTTTGPYAINLLNGVAYPPITSLDIPPGAINAIEFELDLLEPSLVDGMTGLDTEVSDKLQTSTMYMSGSYVDIALTSAPFSFENDMPESFRLIGDAAAAKLQINEQGGTDVIIAFRMDRWFDLSNDDGIGAVDSLSGLKQNGSISISNAGENELNPTHDLIQSNIEDSTEYGQDADGDGVLSDSEDTSEAS